MRTFEVSPWNGNLKLFINFQFRPILKFDQPSGFGIPSLPQVDMTEGHAAGRFWGRILSRILGPNLESDSRDRILSRILGTESWVGFWGWILSRILGLNLWVGFWGRILSWILCFENSKIVSLTNKIARGFLSNLGSCSYQKVFFFSLGLEFPYVLDLLCCPKHACLQNFYIFQLDVWNFSVTSLKISSLT